MIVQTDPRAPRVVLVGPPGAGKSTIGRKLARELGVDLYDTDTGIEEETGRTIPDIFATDGEAEFRRIEERVVRRAVLTQQGVVSLGGGAILSANTRALLRGRTVVYLEISVAEGLRRTGASNTRPLLNGTDPAAKYRELMRRRRPLYREVATVRVRTDGRSPGRVVRMILGKLSLEPAPADSVRQPTPDHRADGPPRRRGGRSRSRRRTRATTLDARRTAPARSDTSGRSDAATPSGTTSPRSDGASKRPGNAPAHVRTAPRRLGGEAANPGTSAPQPEGVAAQETTAAGRSGATTSARNGTGSAPSRRSRRARRSPTRSGTGSAPGPAQTDTADQKAPGVGPEQPAPTDTAADNRPVGKNSTGRSRRARARRTRARARRRERMESERTESEHRT